jgi:WD40 repeat protein
VRRLDGHTNAITRLLVTPDGRTLLSASYDHTIRSWDMQAEASGQETVALNERQRADLKRRSASKIPPAIEAKVAVQKSVRTLEGHRDWVMGLSLSADGKTMASGCDGREVVIWDQPAGKELRRWKLPGWAYAVALSPDGKKVLVSERVPLVFDSGRQAGVKLWDATTGQVVHDLSAAFKKEHQSAAAWSPDGKLLAIGRGGEADGNSGKVTLVDPASGKTVRELTPGHMYGVTDLLFHPDGKHLASTGRDTVVRIWNTADGKMVKELGKPRGGQFKDWIHSIAFTADGQWLAAADMAGSVQVWHFPA